MFLTRKNVGNAPRRFRRFVCRVLPLLLLLSVCTGCEEDNEFVVEVGTAVFSVLDFDLVPQTIGRADDRIQAAQWILEEAELFVNGDGIPRDMTFDEECSFIDTAFSLPVSTNPCSAGIVLGIGDGSPIPVQIRMKFSMTLHRGKPKILSPTGDQDGDEIPNAVDICPYVTDNQEDINANGIGDACEFRINGILAGISDTDGDGVSDGSDNCLWDTNPGQEDTTGLGAEDGIRDGIGDACIEQVATAMGPDATIDITMDAGSIQDLDTRLAFLLVDFNTENSAECFWDAGFCNLETSKIKGCATTGIEACP